MFNINSEISVKIINCDDKILFIIDNFYKNPDEIRNYALTAKKYTRKDNDDLLAYSIGRRICEDDLRLSYHMKDVFEQLCNHPNWHIEFDKDHHDYKWSGMRFMVNVTNSEEILLDGRDHIEHIDGPLNKWACVVYLNTDEECEGGTSFYSWSNEYDYWPKLEYTAKMKYNRAVLYDANMVHGAVMDNDMFKEYDRLVQIMFM
jgi:hypothetical protein